MAQNDNRLPRAIRVLNAAANLYQRAPSQKQVLQMSAGASALALAKAAQVAVAKRPKSAPRKNLRGSQATGAAVMRTSAPMAYGFRESYQPMSGPTSVTRRLPLGNLVHVGASGAASLSRVNGLNRLFINPGNTSMFRWAGSLAAMFQEGRIKNLSISYQPSVGSTTTGRVLMAYIEKTTDTPYTAWTEISQYRNTSSSVWEEVTMPLPIPNRIVPNVDANSNTYSLPGGGAFDPSEYFLGLIQFYDDAGVADGTVIGRISVTFTMDLYRPRPDQIGAIGTYGQCTSTVGGANSVNGAFGDDDLATTIGALSIRLVDLTANTANIVLPMGTYDVNFMWQAITGTVVPSQGVAATFADVTGTTTIANMVYSGSLDISVLSSGATYDAALMFRCSVTSVDPDTGLATFQILLPGNPLGVGGTWNFSALVTRTA